MIHHQLLDRMASRINTWEAAGDRKVIFLACYALMTRNMLQAIEEERFADAAWVHALVHNFAEYYFVALDAYERGTCDALPEVWRQTHDLTRTAHIPPLFHLLLGVNAHINCDLVLVLDDMLREEWAALSRDQRDSRHGDYLLVNTIIGETIDIVQDTVVERYSPGMDTIDTLFGSLDEWCTARLIRNWRDDVWQQAMDLIHAQDPQARSAMRHLADARAIERMQLVVTGGAFGARVFGYSQRWLRRLKLL